MTTKLDRATAALTSGQPYRMGGEWFTFHTFGDRSPAHPQDWPNLSEFAGALWAEAPSEDPSHLVAWNGGQVSSIDGWSVAYRSIDILHETRHAQGWYAVAWFNCDGIACGMIDL